MHLLSDDELTKLKAELARPRYKGLSADDALHLLNSPEDVPNPARAPTVPRPYGAQAIEAMLSAESLGRFFVLPLGMRIIDVLDAQDRPHSAAFATALAAITLPGDSRTVITPAEKDAILARLQETVPDPAWPATIEAPSPVARLFGDPETGRPKSWTLPEGDTISHVQMEDFASAK